MKIINNSSVIRIIPVLFCTPDTRDGNANYDRFFGPRCEAVARQMEKVWSGIGHETGRT